MKKTKNAVQNWRMIEDANVRHIWGCNNSDCPDFHNTVEVFPTFYEDSGIPMCDECGEDMEYSHTEILIEKE